MGDIQLNLTEKEKDVVQKALERYLSELSSEIADTDSMDYRDKLKQERAALHRVLDSLKK